MKRTTFYRPTNRKGHWYQYIDHADRDGVYRQLISLSQADALKWYRENLPPLRSVRCTNSGFVVS